MDAVKASLVAFIEAVIAQMTADPDGYRPLYYLQNHVSKRMAFGRGYFDFTLVACWDSFNPHQELLTPTAAVDWFLSPAQGD